MPRVFAPAAKRLWKTGVCASATLRIRPRANDAFLPLAPAQQPMWLAEQLAPGETAYNEHAALHICGTLDAHALQAALDIIVARHEILRTAFFDAGGEGEQIVLPHGEFPLTVIERGDLRPGTQELDAVLSDFVVTPFDFARGAMSRALLVRLGSAESVLVLAMHHIVRDGWAMGVLLRELSILLDRSPAAAELAPLPIQYGDYALWQRDLAATGAYEQQRAYWLRRLHDAPPELGLPADRPRSATPHSGRQCETLVARPTVAKLRALAKDTAASFFMTLSAAFVAYLHRYTGMTDIVTSFPVAGRLVAETEPLIGCFINTVVLRTQVDPHASFRALLERVSEDARAAYDNQDFPFANIVEALRPERRPGRHPLVQTMITLMDPRRPKLQLPNAQVAPYPLMPRAAKLDLAIEMSEDDTGLTVRFEYRPDMYDDETIRAMLDHFGVLLAAIGASPDTAVADLPLVTAEQAAALAALVDGTAVPIDPRCIDTLIAERAQAAPDAIAVVHGNERLTYAQLECAAGRVAARLRRAGATRDSLVAVMCAPSIAMVVGVLGVLKAGAAYAPIDPRAPTERIAAIVAGCAVIAGLADAEHAERLRAHVPTLMIDADERGDDGVLSAPDGRSSRDLAYVISTSGSTGKPKGVAIEHRSLSGYLRSVIEAYSLAPGDVVLQFHSLSFDPSVQDIFGTLVAGATLAIASPEIRRSPRELLVECERVGVTFFDLPTAFLHLLIDEVASGRTRVPPRLRLAVAGGEALSPNAARAWLERTDVPLINSYGPTEATIAATLHDVTRADCERATVPVGRAIANTAIRIIDESGRPAPRGAVGELVISGSGVARGYVPHDAATNAGFARGRYPTGDFARIDGEGRLHILGRRDGQVKVRGFRIEIGEIEAHLQSDPNVRMCTVGLQAIAGESRLVAHVVPRTAPLDSLAVSEHLRARLPEYMLPAIVPIDTLPLTVTGKIDRRALPVPHDAAPTMSASDAPRDDLERALVAIWEKLLDRTSIGIRENFFAIGGHSLLAVRMAAMAQDRFGVRIPASALFGAQTVETLANAVRAGGFEEVRMLVPLQAGADQDPFVLLHGDYEGGGLYAQRFVEGLGHDIPVCLIRPHRAIDGPVPSIEMMAIERLAALRAAQPTGPYLLGGYCIGGTVAFEIAQRLIAEGEQVPLLVLIDAPLASRAMPALRLAVDLAALVGRWTNERKLRIFARWHRRISNVIATRGESMLRRFRRAIAGDFSRALHDADLAGALDQGYTETIEAYRPQRYDGPVLTINSRKQTRDGKKIDWRPVAPATTVHVIPSDHQALVRDHATALGKRVREEIDRLSPEATAAQEAAR